MDWDTRYQYISELHKGNFIIVAFQLIFYLQTSEYTKNMARGSGIALFIVTE